MTDIPSIRFAPPAPLLNMNQRHHWARDRAEARAWRTAAMIAARNANVRHLPPCYVTVVLPVRDRRRRDPANFTKTVKPIVDGLVDAGVWADDTPEYVTTTEPRLAIGALDVFIEFRPRGDQ